MEEWKPVVGFEGFYEVSNLGEVRSLGWMRLTHHNGLAKIKGKILRQWINHKGYKNVSLMKDGKKHNKAVHRLVAECFVATINKKLTVNHKDCDKNNNKFSNLEWCTNAENTDHAVRFGIFSPSINPKLAQKLNPTKIFHIHSMKANGIRVAAIAIKFDVSVSTIGKILRGEIWKELHPSNRSAA